MDTGWFFPMGRSVPKSTSPLQVDSARLMKQRAKPCPVCDAEAGMPCMSHGESVSTAVHVGRVRQ